MAKALQIRLARLCWTLSARFNRYGNHLFLRTLRHRPGGTMNSVEFDNTEPLAELFKLGPLRYLTVAEIGRDKRMQFAQTYLMMARPGYRPAGAEWRDRSVRASGPAVSGGDRLRAGIRSPGKRQSFPVVLFRARLRPGCQQGLCPADRGGEAADRGRRSDGGTAAPLGAQADRT